ncbi:hypothetical protein ACQB60_10805 [Actinomycetota bacterium Odt1-20B]
MTQPKSRARIATVTAATAAFLALAPTASAATTTQATADHPNAGPLAAASAALAATAGGTGWYLLRRRR